jgi:hypothetical protein
LLSSSFIVRKPDAHSITTIPGTTFQIVMTASCVVEKAAMSSVEACPRRVATSSACVCPTPPGVIAKRPESRCSAS